MTSKQDGTFFNTMEVVKNVVPDDSIISENDILNSIKNNPDLFDNEFQDIANEISKQNVELDSDSKEYLGKNPNINVILSNYNMSQKYNGTKDFIKNVEISRGLFNDYNLDFDSLMDSDPMHWDFSIQELENKINNNYNLTGDTSLYNTQMNQLNEFIRLYNNTQEGE